MLKVMIIDDEPIIRDGLKTYINWAEYGFEICGDAADGEEGLQKIKLLKPDLILVDVKMPEMDGLEMIRNLREMGSDCRVIILSGYSDFAYAQKAMEYDAECYLLKPVDRLSLIEKVKAAYTSIMKERNEQEYFVRSKEISKDKILESFACGKADDELVKQGNLWYGFDFPWEYYQIILMEPVVKTGSEEFLGSAVKKELELYLKDNNLGLLFSMGMKPVILAKDRLLDVYPRCLEEIMERAAKACESGICMAIGVEVRSLSEIERSYKNAGELLSRRFIYHPERVISNRTESRLTDGCRHDGVRQRENDEIVDLLYTAIDLGNTNSINEMLESLKQDFIMSKSSEEAIKASYIRIYTGLVYKLLIHNESLRESIDINETVIDEIIKKDNLQQLHVFFKYKLTTISDSLAKLRPDNSFEKILDYINRNYTEDIKLENLASIFCYNVTYLGKLFYNRTGTRFNTYLDTIRIDKAKQLLDEGFKVYQAAEKAGFRNIEYFHSKFKKYVGMSPAAYRTKKEA